MQSSYLVSKEESPYRLVVVVVGVVVVDDDGFPFFLRLQPLFSEFFDDFGFLLHDATSIDES
jgi:hypothetical protein